MEATCSCQIVARNEAARSVATGGYAHCPIAPLAESVPPTLSMAAPNAWWLIDELVELGHDVTLFASGDPRTRAKLVPVGPYAFRLVGSSSIRTPCGRSCSKSWRRQDRPVKADQIHTKSCAACDAFREAPQSSLSFALPDRRKGNGAASVGLGG